MELFPGQNGDPERRDDLLNRYDSDGARWTRDKEVSGLVAPTIQLNVSLTGSLS